METAGRGRKSVFSQLSSKRLWAWVCCLLFAASTLPLYVISFYNHPYYDDYGFSADVRVVWKETGSMGQVLATALNSAREVRQSWQGTYTGTILSNVQPGVFSESLYFLTTFFLLTAFLLCFGFFLKTVFGDRLGLSGAETAILISLTLTLLVQFMPDPDEAFFWFNGGVGNTFIYALLALSLGLCARLWHMVRGVKAAGTIIALGLITVLLGGGSYGGGIFGLGLYALLTAAAFCKKNPWRWVYGALSAAFLLCFFYSVSAPGNMVRSVQIGYHVSVGEAVLQAFYYGIGVGAGYVRLPLVGVTLLLIPFFAKAARRSSYQFAHPLAVLGAGVCLYCAQFAPPLYGGVFIGGGRIVNTYYQSFVVMWLLYAFYLTGFALRKWDGALFKGAFALSPAAGYRFVLVCCCLLAVGCLAYQRPQDVLPGPQNMAGGSAALSLLRGEAQTYHREMQAREALLNDETRPRITLAPLSAVPEIFMKDLLTPDAPYDVRPALQNYYGKEAIALEGEL